MIVPPGVPKVCCSKYQTGRPYGGYTLREPGDHAAAAIVSPEAVLENGFSGRATWLDLQPGRFEDVVDESPCKADIETNVKFLADPPGSSNARTNRFLA